MGPTDFSEKPEAYNMYPGFMSTEITSWFSAFNFGVPCANEKYQVRTSVSACARAAAENKKMLSVRSSLEFFMVLQKLAECLIEFGGLLNHRNMSAFVNELHLGILEQVMKMKRYLRR